MTIIRTVAMADSGTGGEYHAPCQLRPHRVNAGCSRQRRRRAPRWFRRASGDWSLDATTSPAFLPGHLSAPLSFRLMAGWMDTERATAAGKEADPDSLRE
ncbi:MAG TPA: hypothetical protein VFS82_09930 [Lysobacter sp.]|nr:hypothetical protein [Lysobacter sp.]